MRSHFNSLLAVSASAAVAFAQVPNWPATYQMNASTFIMPCNYSGFTDPSSTKNWGVIDFDWSNAKQIWAKSSPMDCEELLITQANMTKSASPSSRVWVYRNSVKALPWHTSVREKVTDPSYATWFLPFASTPPLPNGSYYTPTCDANFPPPNERCSMLYHDQSQTPGYPSGDGDCAAPGCDVGSVPVGEYLFRPTAFNTSVNNQTFLEWYIDDYVFGPMGGNNSLVDGFFFDDEWMGNGPTEYEPHVLQDLGLTTAEVQAEEAAYYANLRALEAAVLARGKFSFQQLYTDGSTCARPLVTNATCAQSLRDYCAASSPTQTRAVLYAFSPGGCAGDPSALADFDQDLANFLLIRGDYAWLGHAWLGCSLTYARPALLDADFGEPTGLCAETAPGSGVFVRDWTKATVRMDCNVWQGSVVMK